MHLGVTFDFFGQSDLVCKLFQINFSHKHDSSYRLNALHPKVTRLSYTMIEFPVL